MRVDFYQLSQDSAESALPALVRKALAAGERMLVVSADPQQRRRISEALWSRIPDSFLANAEAGGTHDARQPILLSDEVEAGNGAAYVAYADGQWREAEGFARVFLLFDEATLDGARQCWRMLGSREGVERRFWKQMDGRWVEGP